MNNYSSKTRVQGCQGNILSSTVGVRFRMGVGKAGSCHAMLFLDSDLGEMRVMSSSIARPFLARTSFVGYINHSSTL